MPWWTYPAIEWVDGVLRGDERVVEFGSGNSTRWLSDRAARVTSIEHDPGWAERVRRHAAGNVDVRHVVCAGDLAAAPPDDPYPAILSEIPNGDADLIVIDGLARVDCLRLAIPHLEAGALVLLDDADRAELAAGIDLVQASGAVRVDLVGPVPGGTNFGCTSVFAGPDRAFPTPKRSPRAWGLEIPEFWRA